MLSDTRWYHADYVKKQCILKCSIRTISDKNWRPSLRSRLPEQDTPTATVTRPYIRHLLETIRRTLAPFGICTCFRPHCTLQQMLVRLKDRTPLQQQAGVVYRIPCGTCSKRYIDQTWRMLEHCLKEHKRVLVSGNTAQSAVAEYAVDQMHDMNWTGAEVIDSHPYYRQRCALEAWHIHLEHQAMNRGEGPLPAVYSPLIRRHVHMQSDCCIQLFHISIPLCMWMDCYHYFYYILYPHHYMELRCHYHLPLLYSPPSPFVTFPAFKWV